MTVNGWFQIILYLLVIFAVTKPLGVFMARVFNRERTFLDPVMRPVERLLYRMTTVDENHEMRWTEYAVSMLLYSGVTMLVLYVHRTLAATSPVEPAKVRCFGPRSGIQHCGFVHHQYQLAKLFGRDHHELSHPDGWPRVSQLRLCRRRNRVGDRVHSRHFTARKKPLATSGSI